eukprot:gene35775-46421_t
MVRFVFVLFLSSFLTITGWKISPTSSIRRFRFSPLQSSFSSDENSRFSSFKKIQTIAAGLLAATNLVIASPSFAIEQQYKLPPIDYKDKNRCVLSSSSMGQANAARDKLYDLRECDLRGQSGAGKDMSGMIGGDADFTGVNFKEAQISKAFARNSKFVGCDFTNAIVDRVSFDGSDMSQAVFANAVLSGPFDSKNLCANPTLSGTNPQTQRDSRESAGCL